MKREKVINLAYGKRITEISHILILTGSDIFFIASIENKEMVNFMNRQKTKIKVGII